MPYLTPDAIPTETVCRVLLIPDDPEIISIVDGALTELSKAYNFEQFGAVTPDDISKRFWEMCKAYFDSECEATGVEKIAYIWDVKAQGTDGGTFTSGAWRTRTLNSLSDVDGIGVSLSNDEFTVPAGIVRVEWDAPALQVGRNQTRLFSVTENQPILVGTSEVAGGAAGISTRSWGIAEQGNSAPTTYRIEHQCSTTNTNDGFGLACNFSTEIYSRVKVTWKPLP